MRQVFPTPGRPLRGTAARDRTILKSARVDQGTGRARRGARLKRLFSWAILRSRRRSSSLSFAVSGAIVRSCALATCACADDARLKPLAVILTSLARRSYSDVRVVANPRCSRFFTTTATVVRSSATTPPIVALSIGPWVASADRVAYWSGVRSNARQSSREKDTQNWLDGGRK